MPGVEEDEGEEDHLLSPSEVHRLEILDMIQLAICLLHRSNNRESRNPNWIPVRMPIANMSRYVIE
jgi:hypothetical protein